MPNKNYLAGRRFEYDTIKHFNSRGWTCIRASGSHGVFDVVALHDDGKPLAIQCKVVEDETTAKRLINRWMTEMSSSEYYHKALRVKIKGTKEPLEVII